MRKAIVLVAVATAFSAYLFVMWEGPGPLPVAPLPAAPSTPEALLKDPSTPPAVTIVTQDVPDFQLEASDSEPAAANKPEQLEVQGFVRREDVPPEILAGFQKRLTQSTYLVHLGGDDYALANMPGDVLDWDRFPAATVEMARLNWTRHMDRYYAAAIQFEKGAYTELTEQEEENPRNTEVWCGTMFGKRVAIDISSTVRSASYQQLLDARKAAMRDLRDCYSGSYLMTYPDF